MQASAHNQPLPPDAADRGAVARVTLLRRTMACSPTKSLSPAGCAYPSPLSGRQPRCPCQRWAPDRAKAIPPAGGITWPLVLLLLLWGAYSPGMASPDPVASESARQFGYRVVQSFPHDPDAFTQGLLFHDGRLFESTGGYRQSTVRIVHLESGRILRQQALADQLFGEGLALAGGLLYQLTWKAGIGLVRDAETLDVVGEFRYPGEGWGLTARDGNLIMSDGTADLRFLETENFNEIRRLQVRDGPLPVTGLNELELVGGDLFANVWPTNRIAVIDPSDGRVRGWLDLANVLPVVFRGPRTDVLNGVAYDADADRLFVTGKRWPRLFEIEVLPP